MTPRTSRLLLLSLAAALALLIGQRSQPLQADTSPQTPQGCGQLCPGGYSNLLCGLLPSTPGCSSNQTPTTNPGCGNTSGIVFVTVPGNGCGNQPPNPCGTTSITFTAANCPHPTPDPCSSTNPSGYVPSAGFSTSGIGTCSGCGVSYSCAPAQYCPPGTTPLAGACAVQSLPQATVVTPPPTTVITRTIPVPVTVPGAPAPAAPPSPVTSIYCTPPLSSTGGSSCPFVLQVVSGNDIQRISGRESQPPVSVDRSLSGATVTVTLTNNTVDDIDLSHTDIVRTAPGLTPINSHASSGNVAVQGNTLTHDGFSLASAGTSTLTFDLLPDSSHTLPSDVVDAIRGVDLSGVDTQAGKLLSELGGKGMTINLKAGWNLVGGPAGTLLDLPPDALLTLQSGDSSYRNVATRQALQAGSGYLDQLSEDATAILRITDPQTVTVPVPAGQYVLVGNPGTTPATVSGADQVLTFGPVNGYQQTTTLQPGQGAWVFSFAGGLLNIANAPDPR